MKADRKMSNQDLQGQLQTALDLLVTDGRHADPITLGRWCSTADDMFAQLRSRAGTSRRALLARGEGWERRLAALDQAKQRLRTG